VAASVALRPWQGLLRSKPEFARRLPKGAAPTCAILVEQIGTYLGLGLANLVNLFNPTVLVIDQRLKLAGEGLLDRIAKVVRRQALRHATRNLTIRFGKLGNEAIVLGVGSIVLEKYFEIPVLRPPRFMIEPLPASEKAVLNNRTSQVF
jgi:hypothetical protein